MNHGLPKPAAPRVLEWAAAAAIGGFLLGYHAGVISGALLFIREDFGLGDFEHSVAKPPAILGADPRTGTSPWIRVPRTPGRPLGPRAWD
jgi:hypothetical protein